MIEESNIKGRQDKLISDLIIQIGVSDCMARALLLKYMWNLE